MMVVRTRLICGVTFMAFLACESLADGFRNTPEGAAAVGAFGGHRAFADDANAVIHNSANLVDLEQPMLQLNATLGYGDMAFHSFIGADKTENPYFQIPGFSLAVPLSEGKYAFGLSTYVPYGRSVQWGSSSLFALMGVPFEGTMRVTDLTPNFAMRLNDQLSFGVGADLYYGDVNQKQFMAPGMLADLSADGTAVGWNAALTWKMTDRQRLAATYRSPFKVEYKGDLAVTTLPTTPADASIEYPTVAALAYGLKISENLRVEVDTEWLGFSEYQALTINNTFGPLGVLTVPQRLEDTWTFGVGGEWDFAEHWTARSGFMYLENPTPDTTYGTLGPDEDQGVISFGLGYENDKHLFDIGYAYGIFGGRAIGSSISSPPGYYDFEVQLLTLSYGYKF
ncbi:MAG: outer membrane protein transport protein [Pontiellaceae bacterium]|nr:outer membrane protein transport protein [Pontiellaceae bacterium]